jgi:hypothetical protein
MPKKFQERAAKLGLGDPTIWPGEEIDSFITSNDVDQLKKMIGFDGDKAAGEARVKALFDGIKIGSDPESALLHRVHQFIFGAAELSAQDRKLVDSAFPLVVETITAENKTIDTPWHLGKSTSPVYVNLGKLTINQGAYIIIENTILDFKVDDVVRNGNTGNANFGDFNILGVTGTTGGTPPTPGAPGQAQSGQPGNCSSSGVAGSPGGNGSRGADGTPGGEGGKGGDGLPSMPATIEITNSIAFGPNVSQLVVKTMSGAGGPGGQGGQGSPGGQGGNGGNGATCECTGNAGGSGNIGGTGGPGGPGGPGGNAVDASGNIVIKVPAEYSNVIVRLPVKAQPGAGGGPGAAGVGGPGGGAGTGGKHNSGGSPGGIGATGGPGSRGADGTRIGEPAQILIEPT